MILQKNFTTNISVHNLKHKKFCFFELFENIFVIEWYKKIQNAADQIKSKLIKAINLPNQCSRVLSPNPFV